MATQPDASGGPASTDGSAERTKKAGCLFGVAIILFIPAILMTGIGVWLGGIPTPGRTRPMGPHRQSYTVDEVRWRHLRAWQTNDSNLWNEHARIIFDYPRDQWMARQDELIKAGHIPETSRIRSLTSEEQAEMRERVAVARRRNSFQQYAIAWTLFGVPLSLLATLFGVLAFVQAVTRSVRGSRLAMLGTLVALNSINLLLTWWNASGTSLD